MLQPGQYGRVSARPAAKLTAQEPGIGAYPHLSVEIRKSHCEEHKESPCGNAVLAIAEEVKSNSRTSIPRVDFFALVRARRGELRFPGLALFPAADRASVARIRTR